MALGTNSLGIFFIETSTTQPAPVTLGTIENFSIETTTTQPPPLTSSLQSGELSSTFTEPSPPTSPFPSSTPPKPPSSQSPSHSTTILASSVAPALTPATIPPSSNPNPPSSGSAGLSSAAKVGIGLGIPFGILLSAAIMYLAIRHHRHRTVRAIRPTEIHAADTAEKVTQGQSRDDGVVRELYWGAGPG
ncbi:hypothetical protein BDR22DRAFT_431265 [Usnea florida]